MRLILGTRGSDLALAQSRMVRDGLLARHNGLEVELKIITTTGDARTAMLLHEPTAEGAGLFTKQLEEALLSGDIDLAVHSLKDLPVEAPAGLILPAILPRAPVADLLVSQHQGGVAGLPERATVGSSSPRRALLLQEKRPDLRIVPIRGNVPTRIAKIAEGSYDATILAEAGLTRLGHDLSGGTLHSANRTLFLESLDWMLPAPGQGAVAIETRGDDPAETIVSVLHDPVTARCVSAERLVLKYLGGGCHLALGALALEREGMTLLKAVFVPDQNDRRSLRSAEAMAPTPEDAARLVAAKLLS